MHCTTSAVWSLYDTYLADILTARKLWIIVENGILSVEMETQTKNVCRLLTVKISFHYALSYINGLEEIAKLSSSDECTLV